MKHLDYIQMILEADDVLSVIVNKISQALETKVNTVISTPNGKKYMIRRGARSRGEKPGVEVYGSGHSANGFIGRYQTPSEAANAIINHSKKLN